MVQKEEKDGQFEMLEHVVKGVHVDGASRGNNRVLPCPLDRINDARPRTLRRKGARKKKKKRTAR